MRWGYVRNQKDWLVDFTIKINILTSSKFIKILKSDKLGAILLQYNYYPFCIKIFYEQMRKKG